MQVVIIGAGGHGKVVLDIIRAEGRYEPVGFIDADTRLTGTRVGGLPVIGPMNVLPKLRQQKVAHAIVAIGDNRTRLRYADAVEGEGIELINAIHPSAFVSTTALLGRNVVVCPNASVITEARVRHAAIINTGAIVEHECDIGEAVHVAPGACVAGRARVGAFAFIGIGAQIIQCLAVGDGATVGAGSVVLEDVPDGATVVGVPARVVKVGAADQPMLARA
jgi:sugar O-acyltransferase (sialic acid O-acetyltransferase NeuD family)